jgi:molybdopterin-guanine dinucleotide biosynthesis protein
MNAVTQPAPAVDFAAQTFRPGQELPSAGTVSWLWHGFLGRSKVTALTSQTKSGKTTLASLLFARMQAGGQLAGLAVTPGRVVIVSEEPKLDWDARCRRLGIEKNFEAICRPFQGARPTRAQWTALIDHLDSVRRQDGLDLVVIDPLATLLPGHAENSAPQMTDCLLPLQHLAAQGPAVCLLHQSGKCKHADGLAGRGTSALGCIADVNIEMFHVKRPRSKDRRRRLCAYSRYVETPHHLIIELNAEGTDYLVRTDAGGAAVVRMRPEIYYILSNASDKLRQETILEQWPTTDVDPPDRSTLLRWLTRATKQGLICRAGSGYRGDSYRYWLPGREPLLWPGDRASPAEKQAWRERCTAHARAVHGWTGPP